MKLNKLHFLIQTILVITLCISFTAVYAQGEGTSPSYTITEVIPGSSVTILTRDFPANTQFIVSLKEINDSGNFTDVVRFNSQSGGAFKVRIEIPANLASASEIALLVYNGDEIRIPSSFVNGSAAPVTAPTAYGSYSGYPSFNIKEVVAGQYVTISAANFPANLNFTITMGANHPYGNGQFVETFNSGNGGSFEKTIAIPENLAYVTPISIHINSTEGFYAYNWFGNYGGTTANTGAYNTATGQCNFSVTPSFSIKSVVKGESVIIETRNFPANSSFTVKMGYNVKNTTSSGNKWDGGWWGWWGTPGSPANFPGYEPWPSTDDWYGVPPKGGYDPYFSHGKRPSGKGQDTYSFVGFDAGTYYSQDGAPQTVTYSIPSNLKDTNPIVVWIQDQGACGFYAYNYFWNQTAGQTQAQPAAVTIPTIQVEPVP